MAVSTTVEFKLTTRETFSTGVPDVNNPTITHNGYDESFVLNASSTPALTKWSSFLLTLTAGAATINLASLTGAGGTTVDGTGLRVQVIRIKNLGANAMTFSEGASNGIALSCLPLVVAAGGIAQLYLADASPDIASGDRTIDVAGTLVQTAEISIGMG
jgi:hypothetical protein